MRALVLFCGEPFYLQAWQEILYSIQIGRPAWDNVHSREEGLFGEEVPGPRY